MALSEKEKKKIEEEEAYRAEVKGNLKKKKDGIGCLGVLSILFVIGILFSVIVSAINPSRQIERAKQEAVQNVQPEFDVPSLVDKDIDGIRIVLGAPADKQLEPTALQIQMGGNEWSNSFKNAKGELLVTYNFNTRKVIDFFISTDDPSGATSDTDRLLKLGNLRANDPRYTVEFVKVIKDPTMYTGVKIIPAE